jgi:hypothetical protein
VKALLPTSHTLAQTQLRKQPKDTTDRCDRPHTSRCAQCEFEAWKVHRVRRVLNN